MSRWGVALAVTVGLVAALWALRPADAPPPSPSPVPVVAPEAPARPRTPSPDRPTPTPASPEVPPAPLPAALDPSLDDEARLEALGARDLDDAPAPQGPEVTPARVHAAQLYLVPMTSDPPRPGDAESVEATLDGLRPALAACAGDDLEAGDTLEVQKVPMPDGQASALQVQRLPEAADDDTALVCFTEVLRTVRFEWGAPQDLVVDLGAP